MSVAELLEFWDPERWTREYRYEPPPGKDNPYTLGYHIAQDVAGGDWHGPVPVLRAGRIVAAGRSSSIGGFVVVKAEEDGLCDWYCHLNTSEMPKVGQPVTAGWRLPRLARSKKKSAGDNYMGSASSGPHMHFGVMTTITNGYKPVKGRDRDPRPIIRAALRRAAAAAAGGKPRPVEIPEKTAPTPPPTPTPIPVPPEIEVHIMSATPFIAKVKTTRGVEKTFLVQPNPLAASDPKVKPFVAFGWAGDSKDLPVMDATPDWIYNYLDILVERINRS